MLAFRFFFFCFFFFFPPLRLSHNPVDGIGLTAVAVVLIAGAVDSAALALVEDAGLVGGHGGDGGEEEGEGGNGELHFDGWGGRDEMMVWCLCKDLLS